MKLSIQADSMNISERITSIRFYLVAVIGQLHDDITVLKIQVSFSSSSDSF